MTAPTPDPVEALAEAVLPVLPNHCCEPGDLTDCPYDAHDASGIATAVLAAIDSGRVPGVARVEVAKAEAEGQYHRGVQIGLKAAQVAVQAAKGEALREAKGDIKARIATFRGLDAHPEYMAALNDAWGLVANRERDAALAAAPQQVDVEPVALTEEERDRLACGCPQRCPWPAYMVLAPNELAAAALAAVRALVGTNMTGGNG